MIVAVSGRPGVKKKIIAINGGIITIDGITLNIGPGCLLEDTEITLIKDDNNLGFKSLVDLGLVDTIPRVVEFLPDGLKFLKPASLTFTLERVSPDSEPFILHGSYNRDNQRTIWEVMTNEIEERTAEGVVDIKINSFCFYSYIMARHGKLARSLSHLNHSFSCCAYVFYRRKPPMDTIDISVVLISDFVDEETDGNFKQLVDHKKEGYIKAEKGLGTHINTNRHLQVSLHDFPGYECNPFQFKIRESELDKGGFLVNHFKGIAIKSPARGKVKLSEVKRKKILWDVDVYEEEDATKKKKELVKEGNLCIT